MPRRFRPFLIRRDRGIAKGNGTVGLFGEDPNIPSQPDVWRNADALFVSSKCLCTLLGISRRTLSRWQQDGLPQHGTDCWRLLDVMPWFAQYQGKASGGDHREARKGLVELQAERLRMELEERRAELAPVQLLDAVVAEQAREIVNFLESSPGRHGSTDVEREPWEIAKHELRAELAGFVRAQAESPDPVGESVRAATKKKRRSVGRPRKDPAP